MAIPPAKITSPNFIIKLIKANVTMDYNTITKFSKGVNYKSLADSPGKLLSYMSTTS